MSKLKKNKNYEKFWSRYILKQNLISNFGMRAQDSRFQKPRIKHVPRVSNSNLFLYRYNLLHEKSAKLSNSNISNILLFRTWIFDILMSKILFNAVLQ